MSATRVAFVPGRNLLFSGPIPAEMLFLHATRALQEPRLFESEIVWIPFVQVFKQSTAQVAGFADIDQIAEGFQFVDASLGGGVRFNVSG